MRPDTHCQMAFRNLYSRQLCVPVLNPLFQSVPSTHCLDVLRHHHKSGTGLGNPTLHIQTGSQVSFSTMANISLISQAKILIFLSNNLSAGPPAPPVCGHKHVYTHTHTYAFSWGSFSISIDFQSTLRPHHLHRGDGATPPLVIWTELLNLMSL